MITNFKLFEIKTDRPIHVGDDVTWLGKSRENYGKYYTPPASSQINNGDICEITQLKTNKGVIFAKAKIKETGVPIRRLFTENGMMSHSGQDGHWFEFDTYFQHELDSWSKELKRKYNI